MEAKAKLLAGVLLAAVLMAVFVLNGTARAEDPIAKTHYRDISGDYVYRFEFYVGRWELDPWQIEKVTDSYKVHVGFCPTIPPEDREKIKPYLREVLAWLQNAQLMRVNPIEWDVPALWDFNTLNIYIGDCSSDICQNDAKERDYFIASKEECPDVDGMNSGGAFIKAKIATNLLVDYNEIGDAASAVSEPPHNIKEAYETANVFPYSIFAAEEMLPLDVYISTLHMSEPAPIDVQMVHWQSKFSKAFESSRELSDKGIELLPVKFGENDPTGYASPDELPSIYRQVFADLWNDNSDWCPSYFSGVWYDASGKPHYVFHVTAVYYDVVNDDSLTPHYYDVVL
ncbi:MAG: hypothetical protein GXO44_00505, partial [Deferribacteres bacterium]|nr:hypothetical protein [Deferribacteres bacterium]